MNDGYWLALTMTFSDERAAAAWRAASLAPALDALAAAKVPVEDPIFFGDTVADDATGSALLAWASENGLSVEAGARRIAVAGELEGFDGYQLVQPAVFAAAAAAVAAGGTARVGLFADYGQDDGPVNETLTASADGFAHTRTYGWEGSDESARAGLAKSFGVDLETFLAERGGA